MEFWTEFASQIMEVVNNILRIVVMLLQCFIVIVFSNPVIFSVYREKAFCVPDHREKCVKTMSLTPYPITQTG